MLVQLKKKDMFKYANIFMETAEQEKEHAKRFYKFLKDEFADEAIEITCIISSSTTWRKQLKI